MTIVNREALHRAVDELPEESLPELGQFIAYLHYKETHEMDWFYQLRERFEPVREATAAMSETEIDQAIAEAVSEVRRERQTQSGI
ncbi:MAG: hypothetical protein K8J31_02125 [Anaerolineae bacterium]|nr:hypothetical protein [Anaerolineae bacterium]